MIEIVKERVMTLNRGYFDLYWSVGSLMPNDDLTQWTFYILKSRDNPIGSYDVIAGPLQDVYHYRDSDVDNFHRWEHIFYKIRALNIVTQQVVDTKPMVLGENPNLEALYISDMWEILMRSYAGSITYVFNRRKFGTRCPNCWDTIKHQQKFSRCTTCFDTGYQGGYYAPIETVMQLASEDHKAELTSFTKMDTQQTQARMAMFPIVEPDDVLVELRNNFRWKVGAVASTALQRSTVSQIATVQRILEKDVEYDLPLSITQEQLRDKPLIDERQYTNPQS
jgi:hypothetical protein